MINLIKSTSMKGLFTGILFALPAIFTSNVILAQNVAINTSGAVANTSAMLDISSTNSGLLIPRVALTATNAAGPVAGPATSLMVYNTATAGVSPNNVTPGYYYWDGAQWVRLSTSPDWTLLGNTGTSAATNFLGTVDNVDFVIRTFNTERIRVAAGGFVGIGIPLPLERLHVSGNVRVSNLGGAGNRLVYSDPNGTLVNVAAGTNGQVLTQTAGGPAWQNNPGWLITGNAGTNGGSTVAAGTNFVGTTDNQNLDFRTNNIYRGRISNLGEFFIGTLNTVLTGDLMNGVGNATFPWAVNGYSGFDGSGVYGQITSGTTIFAGVQGEYNGTNASGAGVRGLSVNTTAGTGFNAAVTGVMGNATTSGTYKFGVYGSGGTTTRSGGVIGYDYGVAIGGLGYYGFSGLDYSVYGFGLAYTTGVGTGMLPSDFYKLHPEMDPLSKPNSMVGIGIYGGVMGGWVKGLVYGTAFSGDKFGVYVDGKTITNSPTIELIDNSTETRTISYSSVSLTADINSKGRTAVLNGEAFISFNNELKELIDLGSVVVNITPMGNSNGFYVNRITPDGFFVKENNGGVSNLEICWSLTATRKDVKQGDVSSEIVADKFDSKLDGIMYNENNNVDTPVSVWWDGEKVRFDPIPEDVLLQIRGEKMIDYNKQINEMTRDKKQTK